MVAYGGDLNEPLSPGPRQRLVLPMGLENSAYLKKKHSKKRRYNQHKKNADEDFRKTLKVARGVICIFVCLTVVLWENQASLGTPISLSELGNDARNADHDRKQLPPQQQRHDENYTSKKVVRGSQEKISDQAKTMLRNRNDADLHIPRNARKPTRPYKSNPSIVIPSNLNALLSDVGKPISHSDVPFFWHILKSGGTTVKDAAGMCLGKVEASESGVLDGHGNDQSLQKVQISHGKIEYANVDTTTSAGIHRAISMGLVKSELTDVIFSPLLHESSQLFNNTNHQGRAFCLFRHPVDRAVSLFYYLKHATWEPTFSEKLEKIETVEDYAMSEFAENNWMTRFLTNEMYGAVTRDHLDIAKEIVRRKIFVGLTIDLENSFSRFMKYVDWDFQNITTEQRKCLTKYLSSGSNRNKHLVEEGSRGWMALRSKNMMDLELYDYVLQLYEEQSSLVGK